MTKSNTIYTSLFVIFTIAIITLGFLYLQQRQITKDIETELTAEKDSLTSALSGLSEEYDLLVTENDSINNQLLEEQVKIESLISEIKQVKATNYRRIKQYQKELGTLREIMRNYIVQIDSLNRRNQVLIAENLKVKTEYHQVQKEKKELESKNEELASKVAIGSKIIAENILAEPITKKSKITDRVKRTVKVRTCLTLKRNAIALAGSKTVYLRIEGPDGFVLVQNENDLFELEGDMIVFSAKRDVVYENEDVDLCIYWDNMGELTTGSYKVSLFMDGYPVGETAFKLK